ncbi:MAG: ABC transporter permease, partial [Planctomycetes bacterium]|nr:ABC transporter permease [Planctomycetota bacterium]
MALVVAVVLSLPILGALVLRPVVRRVAVRHALRRPVEAMLVILGSLLGTGIITGSLAVGDTIERSIRAEAYDQLGPVDEAVTVAGLEAGERLSAAVEGIDDPALDGVITFATVGATVVTTDAAPVSQPRAQLIEIDVAAAAAFGADPRITGFADATAPGPGDVLVSRDLADRLDLGVGDTVLVHIYGRTVPFGVSGVVPRTGLAGWWTIDRRQQAYNVVAAPGTIASLIGSGADLPAEAEPPTVIAAFSNVGGVISGADGTADAGDAIRAHLAAADPDLDARVVPVKRDLLNAAEDGASSLTQLYFTMGMFAVAAGVLLLVNIFVMLAEERRSELGMLRAIGMRRLPLVGAFAAEGWLYAVVAAALGSIVGIAFGRLIAWRADAILSSGREVDTLDLTFAISRSTIATGFSAGLVIALVTILATSIRISRLNVIAAVRDLPDQPGRRLRRRLVTPGLGVSALGVAWTVAAGMGGNAYGVMTGPVLALLGLAPLLVARLGGRAVATIVSVAVLVWSTASVPSLGLLDIDLDIPVFLVQGLTMAAAAVVLATVHQGEVGKVLGRVTGDALPVRLGMAYPLARRFRTAMTLAMFAIVVLTLVYISIISAMFRNQVDDIAADLSGGFGLIVDSNPSDPIPAGALAGLDGVDDIAPLAYGAAEWSFGDVERQAWPITAFGPELAAAPPRLQNRGGYATDAAAWQAVLRDPGLVIVDEFFLSNAGGPPTGTPDPGDEITLIDPLTGAVRSLTVAALAENDFVGNGAFYGIDGWESLVGDRAVPSRFFVSSTDPDPTTRLIRTTFVAQGADVASVRDLVENAVSQQSGFFALMQQFVGAGLVIGIAGIGVLTVRAVRERRRHVGVLRSLGLQPRAVAWTFLVEAVGIAVEGVVIGVLIALVASRGLVLTDSNFAEGLRWTVP